MTDIDPITARIADARRYHLAPGHFCPADGDIAFLLAQYDALAAENAELRARLDDADCLCARCGVDIALPDSEPDVRVIGGWSGLLQHLGRQADWSARTFGPGTRAQGVIDHIRKELVEIEADPTDLTEWIDVVILALDGAWRSGASPVEIIDTLRWKQARNEAREWPDWRTAAEDKAIEHIRTSERDAD